jgi:NADPH:quinone reductase-like Zn-dependent oxidoreductase
VRAVLSESRGTPRLGEVEPPRAGPGEVVLAVRATALNRADLLQLRGQYPPPPGESAIPGLEAAGEIVELGEGVGGFALGERVAALLAGGGHAELVVAPAGQLLRIPASWSWIEAAALPEAAITAWTNLVVEGRLQPGERVLVSGATSGVGSYVVALAKELRATVVAAGRDRARLERLRPLGADEVVLLDALPDALARAGGPVQLALDLVGGEHLPRLLASLAPRGRLVLVGLVAGPSATLDLGRLLRARLALVGSVLRPRSRAEKRDLVAGFATFAADRLAARRLVPLVDRVFAFDAIADAYAHLESGRPLGKVVVTVGGSLPG